MWTWNRLYPGLNLNLAQTAVSPAQEKGDRGILPWGVRGLQGPGFENQSRGWRVGGGGEGECCL